MNSPLLDLPGAVAGDGVDAAVAAHYGDPLGEQRILLGGGAWVDRSHREVIRVSGADRLSWLHSLLSADLDKLVAGEHREALLLSVQGHVEQHMVISEDGDACWIDVEPGQAESLVAYLDSMKFMLRVDVADVTADWAVVTAVGCAAPAQARLVRPMPWGDDALIPRDQLAGLNGRWAGHLAFEALRVADRRPRLGFDTDHRSLPHELGWIGVAVHTNKGCYRGQETVARVHNLGHAPRRLVLGHLDGSSELLPPVGTPVLLDGAEVGAIGTTAWHCELGPIALAVVRRNVATDAQLVTADLAMAIDAESDTLAAGGDDTRPAVLARAAFRSR